MKSIRNKLILTYLSLALLSVSFAGLLSFFLIIRNAKIQEEAYLLTTARTIAKQIETVGWKDHDQIQEIVDAAGFFQNVEVEVLDRNRNPYINSRRPNRGFLSFHFSLRNLNDPEGSGEQFRKMLEESKKLKELLEEKTEIDLDDFFILRKEGDISKFQFRMPMPHYQTPLREGPFGRDFSHRREGKKIVIPFGNGRQTPGFITVSGGPDFTTQAETTARNALIVSSLSAILISVLFGALIGNKITTPVILLSKAARKMSSGDLDIQVKVGGKDEIGDLARQFNTMAAELKKSFTTISQERDILKQFMQDASHHLRTPVTALTTFQELMLSPAGEEKEKREEFLTESLQQLEKLKWIINKLLHLSRLDSKVVRPEYGDVSTEQLIRKAWQSVYPLAEKKEIKLETSIGTEAATIRCDARWMETAFANLFENSLLLSPSGSTVYVNTRIEEGRIGLRVRDEGPGIQPEDLPRIFERFYRAKENGTPGSGLGLAIVKSVVEAHGGTVSVESTPGEGAVFVITLVS